jgi:hypothetical protein
VEYHDGKVILNRQSLQILIKELKAMEQVAQKAADKGGLVVVREGDTLITTYRLDSFNREPVIVILRPPRATIALVKTRRGWSEQERHHPTPRIGVANVFLRRARRHLPVTDARMG